MDTPVQSVQKSSKHRVIPFIGELNNMVQELEVKKQGAKKVKLAKGRIGGPVACSPLRQKSFTSCEDSDTGSEDTHQ